MRSSIRSRSLALLSRLGAYRLFRFLNRNRVAILFYHGVSGSEHVEGIRNYQGKHVRLSRFRAHLDFLSRHYRVLPLPEVVDALRRGRRLPAHAAVITFDDGYANNATVALPALQDAGISAAFFLTTALVGTDRALWVDEIEQVVASTDLPEVIVPAENGVERLPLRTDDERRAADRRLRAIGKRLPDTEKHRWLDAFFVENGIQRPRAIGDYRFMTWDQVRELQRAGMTIGSHTLTHAIVSRLPKLEMEREVGGARRACEEALGEPCDTFAYPNGRLGDFDDETTALLKRLDFSCGLTTVQGLNAPGVDVYTLKRMGVGDATTVAELEANLSGFTELALRILQRLRR